MSPAGGSHISQQPSLRNFLSSEALASIIHCIWATRELDWPKCLPGLTLLEEIGLPPNKAPSQSTITLGICAHYLRTSQLHCMLQRLNQPVRGLLCVCCCCWL